MISKAEAIRRALEAGATAEEIAAESKRQARDVGTVPFNNMIRALNLLPWHNGRDEWTRLAAALTARSNKRKGN